MTGALIYEMPYGLLRVHKDGWRPVDPDGENRFIDGDTLAIGGQRWRLDGFDTPELGPNNTVGKAHCEEERDLAVLARTRFAELFAWGASQQALLIDVLNERMSHGRYIVRIQIDGVNIGDYLIAEGLAHRYARDSGPKHPFCSCAARLARYRLANEEYQEKIIRRRLNRREIRDRPGAV